MSRSPEPSLMVIFGGSGDLTRRKLIPSLFRLSRNRMIPAGFTTIAVSRSRMTDDSYREMLRSWVGEDGQDETWNNFAQGIFYMSADYHDPATYEKLKELMSRKEAERRTGANRLYYLATPPADYPDIVRHLGENGLSREESGRAGWIRIIIEKPFGYNLASARALNREVSSRFEERQVYRIDHYLGKETVQNILVFRFANGIFEPIWNRQFIDSIQITASENIGVEGRGAYYEQAGALRDMVQNHIMQLIALVAMEPPPDFHPDSVRDEKSKVLRSIRRITPEEVPTLSVRGQYGHGFTRGKEVVGYLEEPGVAPDSRVETFAAVRFNIDNWRWANVPFYIRTGKNLAKRVTEIAIIFRETPHFIFRREPGAGIQSNVLAFRIQPDEGITLRIAAKLPGQTTEMRPVNMDFRYGSTFGPHLTGAYERLLLDCMLGDPTLFNRIDSVETSWALIQPILDTWKADQSTPIPQYESGSWGPAESDELLARDGRAWRLL